MKRHKHADLIIAWANGAIIQRYHSNHWADVPHNRPAWSEDGDYRIKPKEKVKAYLWATQINKMGVDIPPKHFATAEEVRANSNWELGEVIRLDWTMQEREVD